MKISRKLSMRLSKSVFVFSVVCGSLWQVAGATSPPVFPQIPFVDGDTIRWSSPYWHQVQSRITSEFVCRGGTSCQVVNGPYWVTEHRPDGSGSGWLINVEGGEDGTQPLLTPDTFAEAVAVDGNVISWPSGGWYQVQDTEHYEEVCSGDISFCRIETPGQYKVTNHSLGLNTLVVLGQDASSDNPDALLLEGLVLRWPDDGWYQIQQADTYETICEGGLSCVVFPGSFNIINHSSGQRWDGFTVTSDNTEIERPALTRAECASSGGRVVGDIGDGAIHRPDYRCESGLSPIARITYLDGESIATEGEVCCI